MKDISYHILDIVQNSLHAGADKIMIEMIENTKEGTLKLTIRDNGSGMDQGMVDQVTDPFFTSSATKKVGLGLPLLKQNAEQTGGVFEVSSELNRGTVVMAVFNTRNIDMIPEGDLAATLRTLIASDPLKDFNYRQEKDGEEFELNTAALREELDNIDLSRHEVLEFITDFIRSNVSILHKKRLA
jgi:Histidine kinase-, DNA gyrase B-, and HSP90-like ATPase